MKAIVAIILSLSLLTVLSGCGKSKKSASDSSNSAKPASVSEAKAQNISDVYASLPVHDIPLLFSMDLLHQFMAYKPIAEADYHRLTNIADMEAYYDSNTTAARLPQKDDLKFIITCYEEPNGSRSMFLYSFSNELKPLDKLQLYSVEKFDGGRNMIIQQFEINTNYRIKVSKYFDRTLIEQLTYMPLTNGIFEELRDGITTTVAYDSYDQVNYIVQTFVWDHNESGGLIKKDLKIENHRLTEDGELTKVE